MAETLRFYGWSRSTAATNGVRGPHPGRLQGSTDLTLTVDDGAAPTTVSVPYLLMGPGGVTGLRSSVIRSVAPRPGDEQAETTRCPHIEFAAADLPWRYAPDPLAAGARAWNPWLALVVGTPAEVLLEPGGQVTLMSTVTTAYPLGNGRRAGRTPRKAIRDSQRAIRDGSVASSLNAR